MRRTLAAILATLLVALWSSGTFIAAICECEHGPEIECECPHHRGGGGDDADLPPCHRAAAQRKREQTRADRKDAPVSFKNKCGASPARLVLQAPSRISPPQLSLPEPLPEPHRRWRGAPLSLLERASIPEPPPPRGA